MQGVPLFPGCIGFQSQPMSRVCKLVSNRLRWLHTCWQNGKRQIPARCHLCQQLKAWSETQLSSLAQSHCKRYMIKPCALTRCIATGPYLHVICLFTPAGWVSNRSSCRHLLCIPGRLRLQSGCSQKGSQGHYWAHKKWVLQAAEYTLPLRPLGSVQPFLFIEADTPMRFCLTTAFLMDSRPCFLMSVFLLLACTTLRVAGARLLQMVDSAVSRGFTTA